jgi:hypothetical protein
MVEAAHEKLEDEMIDDINIDKKPRTRNSRL